MTNRMPWDGPAIRVVRLCAEPNRKRCAGQRRRWQDAKARWEAEFVARRRAERWQVRDWYPGQLKGETSVRNLVLEALSTARWMTWREVRAALPASAKDKTARAHIARECDRCRVEKRPIVVPGKPLRCAYRLTRLGELHLAGLSRKAP